MIWDVLVQQQLQFQELHKLYIVFLTTYIQTNTNYNNNNNNTIQRIIAKLNIVMNIQYG